MGYYCTVPQCTSLAGKTKNVKFHRFPRDEPMAEKWNLILKRGKPITKYSKVCSLHFTQADYNITTMGQWKTLSKDAVPSQNLPKLNPDGTVMVIRKSRTVKYREGKKDEIKCEKPDKWSMQVTNSQISTPEAVNGMDLQDSSLAYRLQLPTTLNTLTNISTNQIPQMKPKKQDAIMQTDPINSEEDDTQPNNSYSETSEKSYNSELDPYSVAYKEENYDQKKFEIPKDYTKTNEDYIPQTNEEYNKEAEKYALERKAHNGYEKLDVAFQKPVENGYQKVDVFGYDKGFQRAEYGYSNGYSGSADVLRNQQHNLQILQEQHRINENQNFFNENHIKQEIDINNDEEKFLYERNKETVETNNVYENQRRAQQHLLEHIQHQVKREPEQPTVCDTVMQPQGSPYYAANGHNNVTGGYYEQISRPGPELLIAKQNALAAHTQLWQNTRKIPFFYSEGVTYSGTQILHRYEDIPRILQ